LNRFLKLQKELFQAGFMKADFPQKKIVVFCGVIRHDNKILWGTTRNTEN